MDITYILKNNSKCFNRNCNCPFYKESFQGYLPKNFSSVYIIMKCLGCGDKFAIKCYIDIMNEYIQQLPNMPKSNKENKNLITQQEIKDFQHQLYNKNILKTL